jgi:hypothetical protein
MMNKRSKLIFDKMFYDPDFARLHKSRIYMEKVDKPSRMFILVYHLLKKYNAFLNNSSISQTIYFYAP